ncbi:MAG: endonuclease III [Deltaproteobacteria bacterium]
MDGARARVRGIVRALRKAYPHSRSALRFRTPLEILVATILSAQCTDKLVNTITPGLFGKYKSARDFARARQAVLEREIHSTGFYRNKARNIIAAAGMIVAKFGGRVPDTMEDLVSLPGVARKTANIVLSSAFKKAEGIAVDTHVGRLAQRLGLSGRHDPEKIEQDLLRVVPRKDWLDFNYMLVSHGRAVCIARMPKCPACCLRRLCPSARQFYPDLKTG